MSKISSSDPFDLNLCMRGLGNIVTYMHSDLYEYMYYFTFKRAMKKYAMDFKDPWEQNIEEAAFFHSVDDPFVQNCSKAESKLIKYKQEITLRFGIDEIEDLNDNEIIRQSHRFRPYFLVFKRSKSYKKLKLQYERALSGFIECLYLYACALTARSNKIPRVLKSKMNLPDDESFRLLNHDDANVVLLIELITGLRSELNAFRLLFYKLPKKA